MNTQISQKHFRRLAGAVFLVALMTVWGCTATTGPKFAGLTPNQSTTEEVRKLLGEPEEIRSQEDSNVWKYTFYNARGQAAGPGNQKALETEIIFDKEVMKDYKVSVVTKTVPERPVIMPAKALGTPHMEKMGPRMGKGLNPRARHLLERFDLNRDGRITRGEFEGSAQEFDRMDKNHDQVIGPKELEHL